MFDSPGLISKRKRQEDLGGRLMDHPEYRQGVCDAGATDVAGSPYFVMELDRRGSRSRIYCKITCSLTRRRRLGSFCAGLAGGPARHQRGGIIHRDIKPSQYSRNPQSLVDRLATPMGLTFGVAPKQQWWIQRLTRTKKRFSWLRAVLLATPAFIMRPGRRRSESGAISARKVYSLGGGWVGGNLI